MPAIIFTIRMVFHLSLLQEVRAKLKFHNNNSNGHRPGMQKCFIFSLCLCILAKSHVNWWWYGMHFHILFCIGVCFVYVCAGSNNYYLHFGLSNWGDFKTFNLLKLVVTVCVGYQSRWLRINIERKKIESTLFNLRWKPFRCVELLIVFLKWIW